MRILLTGLHKNKIHDTDKRQTEARSLYSLTKERLPLIIVPLNVAIRNVTDKHNNYKDNKYCHSSFHFLIFLSLIS